MCRCFSSLFLCLSKQVFLTWDMKTTSRAQTAWSSLPSKREPNRSDPKPYVPHRCSKPSHKSISSYCVSIYLSFPFSASVLPLFPLIILSWTVWDLYVLHGIKFTWLWKRCHEAGPFMWWVLQLHGWLQLKITLINHWNMILMKQ